MSLVELVGGDAGNHQMASISRKTSSSLWIPEDMLFFLCLGFFSCEGVLALKMNEHENVSRLLDSLLEGYDNSLRPDFGGPPTVVEIDINVRSMGPISEVDMTYSMDCYFRQTWVDKRLAFLSSTGSMTLSISMLKRIWKPDTHFFNGRLSYLHVITVPNKFVRIETDGRVLYSQRLTIQASCPMNLENFPMDSQKCPLQVGSFGYSDDDVSYRWNAQRRVVIASDMKMSQFDLIETPSGNQTDAMRSGDFSTLLVMFHLQRHMGYFVIQVYFPCTLLVVLSWVAFWINREATADRIALGVTTVLTMTFLGMESRNDLPKVSYSTALDFFVAISFVFVFATIIQFALVHYFTKVGSGEMLYLLPPLQQSRDHDPDDLDYDCGGTTTDEEDRVADDEGPVFNIRPSTCKIHSRERKAITNGKARPSYGHDRHRPTTSVGSGLSQMNSVSRIDRASRILFPASFLVMNLCYWYIYLSRTRWKSD